MALRFCDSFDHYATAQRDFKWSGSSIVNSANIGSTGRFSTSGLTLNNAGIYKTIDSQGTWIIGFALKVTGWSGTQLIMKLQDSGTDQVDLRINSATGFISATRAGTTLGTGTIPLVLNTFYFVEVKFVISDSVGVVVTKINGVTDLNLSSQDTKNTANATANQIWLTTVNSSHVYDDLYVCDGTGGSPTNDFLGDIRVEALFPSGNGNSSQFTGSDGNSTDNYLLVDESSPNDDTDYVEDGTVNDKDTYAFGNLTTTTGTVYGVQQGLWCRKTSAGSRSVASVARVSATETQSADFALSATYQYALDIKETKPGGGAWTVTDVNNAEFGEKVTA